MTNEKISQAAYAAVSSTRMSLLLTTNRGRPGRLGIALSTGALWFGAISVFLSSALVFLHAMGQIIGLCPSHLPC